MILRVVGSSPITRPKIKASIFEAFLFSGEQVLYLGKMITWAELKKVSLQDRVQALYEHATFVMAIRYYSYKINLYLLGDEYVEVFVDHKHATIERIQLLDRTHTRMKFYHDQIKLGL